MSKDKEEIINDEKIEKNDEDTSINKDAQQTVGNEIQQTEPVKETGEQFVKRKLNPLRISYWLMISALITTLLMFFTFGIAGFTNLNFDNAAFYYNALRCYDDQDIFKHGYLTMDIEKKTMMTEKEIRYYSILQPSNHKGGNCMAGSSYVAPFQDAFPIKRQFAYRCYQSDEMVLLERAYAENRRRMLLPFDDTPIKSFLYNVPMSKAKLMKVVDQGKIRAAMGTCDPFVRAMSDLVGAIFNEFINMYRKGGDLSAYKLYFEYKDGKVVPSNELKDLIEKIINNLPIKDKLANKGTETISVESICRGIYRLGVASPNILDSLVIGKFYNVAYVMLSSVDRDAFKDVDQFKKLSESLDAERKKLVDKKVSAEDLDKFDEGMAYQLDVVRAKLIARGISIAFSNLFKSEKLEQKDKFPFSYEKDPRSGFTAFFTVSKPSETTEEALAICKAIFNQDFEEIKA